MQLALSIAGTLATLTSVIIASLAFTTDARLHRRITRLRDTSAIMVNSPSPVITRALRYCLAELQARELLRHRLRSSRFHSVLFSGITIYTSLFLVVIAIGPLLGASMESDWKSVVVGGLFCASTTMLCCFVMTHYFTLCARRDDYTVALFRGRIPPEDQLAEHAHRATNHPQWKRMTLKAALTTCASNLCGLALGLVALALLTPAVAYFLLALAGLTAACAGAFLAFAQAGSATPAKSRGWPLPARTDFFNPEDAPS
ncbi:MAG: hypothetical protein DI611_13230 [Brachybacterium faecium]|nr:MAG: hypothetical protein DI611_13230 [Brachybacterium faecium]